MSLTPTIVTSRPFSQLQSHIGVSQVLNPLSSTPAEHCQRWVEEQALVGSDPHSMASLGVHHIQSKGEGVERVGCGQEDGGLALAHETLEA